ncbi:MAG: SPOR domain-containing protein [Magnetococcales bacterium]|nr:SPOR domain-containing protein [Magnetococcales bacterium]
MTTPRYPTSAKYRRHRSKSYLTPAILGVLFGGGVFLLIQFFTGDDVEEKSGAKATATKVEIPEDFMPASEDDAADSKLVSLNIPIKFKPRNEPKPEVKRPLQKPVEKQQKTVEKAKTSKKVKIDPTPKEIKTKQSKLTQQAQEQEPEEVVVAPLPKDLRPKHRDPDIEITFYREFSKRKVVVPKEEFDEPAEDVSGLIEVAKVNRPRPKPQAQKVGLLGVYQVQLVIFSSLERAQAVVLELRKKRAPAYLVKVKGDKDFFYRVRLGPFSSQNQAKWAMERWKIKGSSPLILRQRP